MGTTKSFSPVYRKNAKDQKVKVGISFGGVVYLGINHPSEIKAKPVSLNKLSSQLNQSQRNLVQRKPLVDS